jgi:hypothetical protein
MFRKPPIADIKFIFVWVVVFLFSQNGYSQSIFSDAGIGLNAGTFRNRYTTEKPIAAVFAVQPTLQLNVWKRKIGLISNASVEYAFQPNNQSTSFQLDRAIYFTPGMRLNFSGNPLSKNLFIEYGFGLERRIKLNESSYWNVGSSSIQFENRYTLLPVHFSLMKPGKKLNVRYRLNLSLQTPTQVRNSWAFSTISLGVDILKPMYRIKKYYNGTRRTLQVDDVWHPSH